MAIYSFLPPLHEVKFCGVPSCVFDKLRCALGEKRLRNTPLDEIDKGMLQHYILRYKSESKIRCC
jgi:hypothetical protein